MPEEISALRELLKEKQAQLSENAALLKHYKHTSTRMLKFIQDDCEYDEGGHQFIGRLETELDMLGAKVPDA